RRELSEQCPELELLHVHLDAELFQVPRELLSVRDAVRERRRVEGESLRWALGAREPPSSGDGIRPMDRIETTTLAQNGREQRIAAPTGGRRVTPTQGAERDADSRPERPVADDRCDHRRGSRDSESGPACRGRS